MRENSHRHRLAETVHAHWLLGYGKAQIRDNVDRSSKDVDDALKRTPAPSSGRSGDEEKRVVVQDSPVTPANLRVEVVDKLERQWRREYPDVRRTVGRIFDSLTLDCERDGRDLVLDVTRNDSYCGAMEDLARLIESEVTRELRAHVSDSPPRIPTGPQRY